LLTTLFIAGSERDREVFGSFVAVGNEIEELPSKVARNKWFTSRASELAMRDDWCNCEAALRLMQVGFVNMRRSAQEIGVRDTTAKRITSRLVAMLEQGEASAHAASWALLWLIGARAQRPGLRRASRGWDVAPKFMLDQDSVASVVSYLGIETRDGPNARYLLRALSGLDLACDVGVLERYVSHPRAEVAAAAVRAVAKVRGASARRVLRSIVERDEDFHVDVVVAAIEACGEIRGSIARETVAAGLRSSRSDARCMAIAVLASRLSRFEQELLSHDFDALEPFIDPAKEIDEARVRAAISHSGRDEQAVRRAYEDIPETLGLELAWRDGVGRAAD
jgi:hypothetical protein